MGYMGLNNHKGVGTPTTELKQRRRYRNRHKK
jgi:hypothetical protein